MLREKASLHEGHGFSRAIKGLPTTALAAEVRFFDTYGATSSLSAAVFAADDWKDVPQRLKPSSGERDVARLNPCPSFINAKADIKFEAIRRSAIHSPTARPVLRRTFVVI